MKYTIGLLAIIIGTLALVSVFFLQKEKTSPVEQGKEEVSMNPEERVGAMFLSPSTMTGSAGEEMSAQITVDTAGQTVSSMALRLVYSYTGSVDIQVIDGNQEVGGTQVSVNSALATEGWSFPVNEVTVNDETQEVYVDLAAVNLSPQGYTTTDPLELGTLTFMLEGKDASVAFEFDQSQTKMISKDGQIFTPNLTGAVYSSN